MKIKSRMKKEFAKLFCLICNFSFVIKYLCALLYYSEINETKSSYFVRFFLHRFGFKVDTEKTTEKKKQVKEKYQDYYLKQ